MSLSILLQFVVVLGAIWMGARYSGVGLGLWGAVGLLALVVVFGVNPTSPPVDVMLIILAVIMAASVMDAAGGIDFLVRIAERIIRANPKYVTIVAPLTTWTFTFLAGTGHIVYPLLPVIYETAHQNGIRPERPMAVATIASQQAITASPVAAATAAMIGLFAEKGVTQWGLPQILIVCVPSTLIGVLAAAIVSMFIGKDLKDDPEHQATTNIWINDHVNPDRVPMSWKILLSGYVAEYLYDDSQLEDMGLSFPELQRRAHVNARAKAADSAADFSRRIRDYSDVEPSEHAHDRQWRWIFKELIPGLLSRAGVAPA